MSPNNMSPLRRRLGPGSHLLYINVPPHDRTSQEAIELLKAEGVEFEICIAEAGQRMNPDRLPTLHTYTEKFVGIEAIRQVIAEAKSRAEERE